MGEQSFMWKKKKSEKEEENLNRPEGEKNEEINESLQEIYADEDGEAVDVRKFDIKKRRGPLFWLAVSILTAGLAGLGGWFYRDYSTFAEPGKSSFEIAVIPSKEKVSAGEEITVAINFKNMEKTAVSNFGVRAIFPKNFIITQTEPLAEKTSADSRNLFWNIGSLDSKRSGEVLVKGKIIAPADSLSTIYAEAVYTPANFSSEFKKTATAEIGVIDIGVNFNFSAFTSAVAGEENELKIKFAAAKENRLENFTLKMENKNSGLEIIPAKGESPAWLKKNPAIPGEWAVSEIVAEEREIPVNFKISGKSFSEDELKISIITESGGEEFNILEKTFPFEVIKGDLALSLIVNGSKNDQGINSGDKLSYLIGYSNKGETALKDVIIMAVIEGEAVSWSTLDDPAVGKKSGDTLSWSKAEIPELENISPGAEGSIEFSLKTQNPSGEKRNEEIKSYARYSISGKEESKDNVSNTIINKINSRLELTERVVYFNEDNIAVGSGPLPPKAGEITVFHVSWAAGGNIHELSGTSVEMSLPEGVSFAGREYANVGQITYSAAENKVIWTIGRLPVLSEMITADFNLSVSPVESDRGKIMVLSGGSKASGLDSETNTPVISITKPKTTKLEDDEIGASDGVVR